MYHAVFRLFDYFVWFPVWFPPLGHPSPGNGSPTSTIPDDWRSEVRIVSLVLGALIWCELIVIIVVDVIADQTRTETNRTLTIFKFIRFHLFWFLSAMRQKTEENKKSVKRKESESRNRNLKPTLLSVTSYSYQLSRLSEKSSTFSADGDFFQGTKKWQYSDIRPIRRKTFQRLRWQLHNQDRTQCQRGMRLNRDRLRICHRRVQRRRKDLPQTKVTSNP